MLLLNFPHDWLESFEAFGCTLLLECQLKAGHLFGAFTNQLVLLLVRFFRKHDVLHHITHALLVRIVLVVFTVLFRINLLIARDDRPIRIKLLLLVILFLRLQAAIQFIEIGDRFRDQLDVFARFARLKLVVRRGEHLSFLLLSIFDLVLSSADYRRLHDFCVFFLESSLLPQYLGVI